MTQKNVVIIETNYIKQEKISVKGSVHAVKRKYQALARLREKSPKGYKIVYEYVELIEQGKHRTRS